MTATASAARQTRHASLDPADVPPVCVPHMMLALGIAREEGHGLSVLRGIDDASRARIEARFWSEFSGGTREGVAVLLRLRSLSGLFAARRLEAVLLDRGYAIFEPAAAVAASMRLNADWGFNPQRFLLGLTTLLDRAGKHAPGPAARRVQEAQEPLFAA